MADKDADEPRNEDAQRWQPNPASIVSLVLLSLLMLGLAALVLAR